MVAILPPRGESLFEHEVVWKRAAVNEVGREGGRKEREMH